MGAAIRTIGKTMLIRRTLVVISFFILATTLAWVQHDVVRAEHAQNRTDDPAVDRAQKP